MKFALILMIKNESKIIKRCLEALESVVDCFCICDTGSTDNTCEIVNEFLQNHTGCLTTSIFKDFGTTRTISFQNAKEYISTKLDWKLNETYGLLLDADMVFVPNKLKEQNLTEIGYTIIQKNGNLEYYNTRIVRMDFDWKCIGVTHEYWDGPTKKTLGKDICFIDDRNDGGCKNDKFERDARLLEQGLVDEPENVRYMFYLAQTYKCVGKYDKAIEMYKKRIVAGGWYEEVWYSHYMIGDCYKSLKNIPMFECWMQLAHQNRPQRSESIYKLAEYYRIIADHYKSYQYIKLGKSIPFPKDDVLFIEVNVYNNALFEYEQSIVEYYIHPERCLKTTIEFMLKSNDYQQNCLSNLKFSVKPIPSQIEKLELPSPFGENFRPSAISLHKYPFANVRFVNYWIDNGDYKTKDSEPVQTENAYINLETKEVIKKMEDSSIILPRFDTHVKGLEDIRLFENNDTLQFTAISVREYQENLVRVITGDYSLEGDYKNVRVLESPINSSCEKNWLPISNTNTFIYGWYPFRIVDDKNTILKTINTPPLFNLFRGSAPPIQYENEWISLVHFVEYSKPRKYYHCFVKHDSSMAPKQISFPFCFKEISIEYCVSFRAVDDSFECYVSFMDKDPHKISISMKSLQWISI
jgi:glycosyltransferase involved in cell wall biosynthesis